MPEIISVHSGGDMLDIHLDNGNILMLDCALLLRQPSFEELEEDDRVLYPHAKKDRIYWRDGPELTISQIMALMAASSK